jgi:hypothetical protein
MTSKMREQIIIQCRSGNPSARFALAGLVKRAKLSGDCEYILEIADICGEANADTLEIELRDLIAVEA